MDYYKVPKLIHQTWKTSQIPTSLQNYVQTWKEKNPDFEYMLWTDRSMRELIKKDYPWFLKYYDSYPHHIMRVDAFRLFVLHKHGGIYVDLDVECYKSPEPLLKESPILLFQEWEDSISNAVIGAAPGHPFLEYCHKALKEQHSKTAKNSSVWKMTGLRFLTDTVEHYKKLGYTDFKVYPKHYFFPIGRYEPKGDQNGLGYLYPHSYGARHWQGTWWQKQPETRSKTIIFIILFLIVAAIILVKLFK